MYVYELNFCCVDYTKYLTKYYNTIECWLRTDNIGNIAHRAVYGVGKQWWKKAEDLPHTDLSEIFLRASLQCHWTSIKSTNWETSQNMTCAGLEKIQVSRAF